MGADNSTVKITIDVVDAKSGQTIAQVNKNLASMGQAGDKAGAQIAAGAKQGLSGVQRLAASLKEAGTAGTEAGEKISKGMKEAGGHALSSLDNVRLLRDDLGIRIPRAMEKVIASSQVAMKVIGGLGAGMVALGSIEVIARLGTQVYDLYKRFLDTNGIVDAFNKKLGVTADKKFMDIASIEDVNARLRETDATLTSLQKKKQSSVGIGGLAMSFAGDVLSRGNGAGTAGVYANRYFNAGDAGQMNASTETSDDAKRRLLDENHQQIVREIADQKTLAGVLTGTAKARADYNAAVAEAQERRRYDNARAGLEVDVINRGQDKWLPKRTLDPNAGASQETGDIGAANATKRVSDFETEKKDREETERVEAEARRAHLQGEAAFYASYQEEVRRLNEQDDLRANHAAMFKRQMTALDDKYWAEKKRRLEEENAETARMQAEAAAGGQRGLAGIDARTASEIAAVDKAAPGFSDPETKAQREAAIRSKANQEATEAQQQFTLRLAQMEDGRGDKTMSVNARIAADARRTVAEIEKAWQEEYGQLGALDQRRVQSRQAVDDAIASVNRDAVQQQQAARQAMLDETEKAEDDGRRRGLSKNQEQQQAILDEYREKYNHLEELRAKDADNADLYRRQEIAAEEVKNGKLLEQQREMRDKLAGELRGFMTNPLEALKKSGEEAASKYAASFLLKAGGGAGNLGAGSGLPFDIPFGHKHKDAPKPMPAISTTSSVSAASTTLTTGTATIHVGSATFSGMGGNSGAAVPAAVALAGGTRGNVGVGGSSAGAGGTAGTSGFSASSMSGGFAGAGAGLTALSSTGDVGTGAPAVPELGKTGGEAALGSADKYGGMVDSVDGLAKQLGGGMDSVGAGAKEAASGASDAKSTGQLGSTLGGGLGMFSAIESNGGFGGAMTGASAGAQLGQAFGPAGELIGAGIGAVIGLIGFGGAEKAKQYEKFQVRPKIAKELLAFGMGTTDYSSAYDDLTKLDMEANKKTREWGMGGRGEYSNRIRPEIAAAQSKLTSEQKAGRSQYGMTAAQYDNGGLVNDFGSMGTTADQGWIHAQRGEFVMRQQAVPSHYQPLTMMQGGASHTDMANYYGASRGAGGGSTMPAASSPDVNMHFYSHDPRGTHQLFMDNKHSIRAAVNDSYAENSGGSDLG